MKRLKGYLKEFACDESGTAMIEWIIVIAIVVGLTAVVLAVRNAAGDKMESTIDQINAIQTPEYEAN